MATGIGRHFGALAAAARHVGAMPSKRLFDCTVGWSVTLSGMVILLNDVSATITPLLRGVADAVMRAIA